MEQISISTVWVDSGQKPPLLPYRSGDFCYIPLTAYWCLLLGLRTQDYDDL